ncbi:hypothetical protein AcW1_000143 [Taiwanofungus camphoratus]|nr:hypothetical protein AcW2_001365 [Antrodia cinnamomea]KAI0935689.1 hypothetical protein AcV5_004038 [Antrodia cinnamomea]KAI0960914.1 hypothetical protein AcV7_000161 [Antrodia cinnamomea]KAI0962911.1 hypothetical protein AcW1_000143 [Antrodia cinnamomea]
MSAERSHPAQQFRNIIFESPVLSAITSKPRSLCSSTQLVKSSWQLRNRGERSQLLCDCAFKFDSSHYLTRAAYLNNVLYILSRYCEHNMGGAKVRRAIQP